MLLCTRTKDESAEMAGNPLIFKCLDLCTWALSRYGTSAIIRLKFLLGEGCTVPWAGSSLDQVLIVPCTRTKDEAAEMAGNPLIPECLDFCTLGVTTPRHKRKHPMKVPESRGLYIALDWIIIGTGAMLALHTNLGRISRNGRESIYP